MGIGRLQVGVGQPQEIFKGLSLLLCVTTKVATFDRLVHLSSYIQLNSTVSPRSPTERPRLSTMVTVSLEKQGVSAWNMAD